MMMSDKQLRECFELLARMVIGLGGTPPLIDRTRDQLQDSFKASMDLLALYS